MHLRLSTSTRRAFAASAAPVVSLLIAVGSASGGYVAQTVTSIAGGSSGVDQMNITVSNLPPSILMQANQDEAYSSSVLNGLTGSATLNVHACSGPTFVGNAEGNGSLGYSNTYIITSSTLATGTQVYLNLTAAGARRATPSLDIDPGRAQVSEVAGAHGDAQINFGLASGPVSFAGTFVNSMAAFDPPGTTKTGLFNGQDSSQLATVVGGTLMQGVVAARVGDSISVSVGAEIFSTSYAFPGATADVDAQMTLQWGIHPLDSRVQLTSSDGYQAPDNGDLTLGGVIASLPPRPPTVAVATPEPTAFLLFGEALAAGSGLCWARHRLHTLTGGDVS